MKKITISITKENNRGGQNTVITSMTLEYLEHFPDATTDHLSEMLSSLLGKPVTFIILVEEEQR